MLTDEAKIYIKAGDGGAGHISFRREKYIPKGGPDGGDGGKGGDIYFVTDNSVHALADYARKSDFKAIKGDDGMPKKKTGKDAPDLILKVPVGTILKQDGRLIHDFTKLGEKIKIARGGRGGWGNIHFATATHQTPYIANPGAKGEEKHLSLELKLIADVGIVGLPSSGKSSLLAHISNARPKIAEYPFTTLEPNLGVVKIHDDQVIFADIPGLIEGASGGKGLGIKFLRHLERTKILVHLIDIGSDDLVRDYQIIRKELGEWSEVLLNKQEYIVLNKSDILDPKDAEKIRHDFAKKTKKTVYLISAVSGSGVDVLLNDLAKEI